MCFPTEDRVRDTGILMRGSSPNLAGGLLRHFDCRACAAAEIRLLVRCRWTDVDKGLASFQG